MSRGLLGTSTVVAAVAIAGNLPLHPGNPADFAHIDGLQVVPVEQD